MSEKTNINLVQELEQSKAERLEGEERINREKSIFAESLKNSIGEEIKMVLSEKKEIEARPQKKSKIKAFLERLVRVCQ